MKSLHVRTVTSAAPPLGKVDWIGAGLAVLVAEGVDAVQITRLARDLGVTRGSYYWHFVDRKNLLDCMMDEWRAANLPVIERELSESVSLSEGVLSFFAIWETNTQFSAQLDHAVRDWARLDAKVLDIVRLEDTERIKSIACFFERFGFAADEAIVRARVLYFAQIGYHALAMEDSMEERLDMLEHYFLTFTGQGLDEDVARRFRLRMSARVKGPLSTDQVT